MKVTIKDLSSSSSDCIEVQWPLVIIDAHAHGRQGMALYEPQHLAQHLSGSFILWCREWCAGHWHFQEPGTQSKS